jgi:hypothetical protein
MLAIGAHLTKADRKVACCRGCNDGQSGPESYVIGKAAGRAGEFRNQADLVPAGCGVVVNLDRPGCVRGVDTDFMEHAASSVRVVVAVVLMLAYCHVCTD